MIWMDVPGFPGYKASLDGQLMSLKGTEPRILKQCMGSQGYLIVGLRQGDKTVVRKVHVFIALAFYGLPKPGEQVRHLDGNKLNNHMGNLQYGTSSEDSFDQVEHGTHYEASRDCCDRGHEFTPENTMHRKGRNGNTIRKCKECHRLSVARYRAKKAEELRPKAAEYARKWRARQKEKGQEGGAA